MCSILFAYQVHPQYQLILLANRDEFYERPSLSAHFWDEYPEIYAGKDLKAGGTWLGMNRSGQFAALTNYRDPSRTLKDALSRGELPLRFLKKKQNPDAYLKEIAAQSESYNGFNLICGNIDQLWYYSNYQNKISKIEKGIHGLSNHLLDTNWPKLKKGKSMLENALKNNALSEKVFLEILHDEEVFPDKILPQTGIPLEWERAVSPLFIRTEKYGTCSSSILLWDWDNKVSFVDFRYQKKGKIERNAMTLNL